MAMTPGARPVGFYVTGYTQVIRAFDRSVLQLGEVYRKELKAVGDIIQVDARQRFMPYDVQSAKGYRTYVTQMRVYVGQSIRKKQWPGRPDYGKLQMAKALLPALLVKRDETIARFESALDAVLIYNFWRSV